MERKTARKNSGSAMVVAIVIMLLVMMLSLALLLACYSLRQSAVRQRTMEQCKEIAQGVSKELEAEITHDFPDYAQVQKAMEENSYPLWSYLRCNLWQTSWPYFNEDEARHQESSAYRYFTLDYGAADVPGTVTVAMYWESEMGADKVNGTTTSFFVEVTCEIGRQKSVITTEYMLDIEKGKEGYTAANEEEAKVQPDVPGNPEKNTIQKNEKWTFSLVERE